MTNQRTMWLRFFRPIFILFILINSACFFLSDWLSGKKIDPQVVMAGNTLLFILALVNGAMRLRAMRNSNPNVIVRSVMGGTFVKLIIIAAAVMIYLFTAGEKRSVYAVIVGMALYVFYTIIETKGAIQMNKKADGES